MARAGRPAPRMAVEVERSSHNVVALAVAKLCTFVMVVMWNTETINDNKREGRKELDVAEKSSIKCIWQSGEAIHISPTSLPIALSK